jgi:hypothetical protein
MDKKQTFSVSWISREYKREEKTVDWYWTIGIAAVIGAIVAFYFGNILFGILIIVSGAMIFLLHIHEPREVNYEINQDGIFINNQKIEFKNILFFDIKEDPEDTRLKIMTKDKFMPVRTMHIEKEDSLAIEESLSLVLEKKEIPESQIVQFANKIGI